MANSTVAARGFQPGNIPGSPPRLPPVALAGGSPEFEPERFELTFINRTGEYVKAAFLACPAYVQLANETSQSYICIRAEQSTDLSRIRSWFQITGVGSDIRVVEFEKSEALNLAFKLSFSGEYPVALYLTSGSRVNAIADMMDELKSAVGIYNINVGQGGASPIKAGEVKDEIPNLTNDRKAQYGYFVTRIEEAGSRKRGVSVDLNANNAPAKLSDQLLKFLNLPEFQGNLVDTTSGHPITPNQRECVKKLMHVFKTVIDQHILERSKRNSGAPDLTLDLDDARIVDAVVSMLTKAISSSGLLSRRANPFLMPIEKERISRWVSLHAETIAELKPAKGDPSQYKLSGNETPKPRTWGEYLRSFIPW